MELPCDKMKMPCDKMKEFTFCVKNKNKSGALRMFDRCREERVQPTHGICRDSERLDRLIARLRSEIKQ